MKFKQLHKIVVSDSDEQQNAEKEQTTAAILERSEETNIDKTDIVNLDFTNQSIGKDYSKDLYLPDEDPIDNTIDDTLGSDDILDVINDFISEKERSGLKDILIKSDRTITLKTCTRAC
jgi:hypothetical protein